MKKLLLLLIILLLRVNVWAADVILQTTIKEDKKIRVFDAVKYLANKNSHIEIYYPEKAADETNSEYAERVQKTLWKMLVLRSETLMAINNYETAVATTTATIPLPSVVIPDDIVE